MKAKKPTKLDTFKKEADEYSQAVYGSTLADLMIDESDIEKAFEDGDTPKQYVDWLGEKYAFTKKADFSYEKALQIMSKFKS